MTAAVKAIGSIAGSPAIVTALTVAVFVSAQRAQSRWPNTPLLNPTLIGVVAMIGYIKVTGISFQSYINNTQVLSFMLAPTVVLLAIPLYRRLALIRASWKIIAVSLMVGLPTGVLSAVAIAIWLGAKADTLYSLAPKSVTTGIAIAISEAIGGIPGLTAAFVISTGIFGAAFGPILLKLIRVRDERAIGLAIGIGAHGIGTARAFQISNKTGAFSSLGMALNGIASAIVIPAAVTALRLSRDIATSGAHSNESPSRSHQIATDIAKSAYGQGRGLLIMGCVCTVAIMLAFVITYRRRRQQNFVTNASAPGDRRRRKFYQ